MTNILQGKTIHMRLVRVEDAAFILSLRQDPSLNQHISATDITLEDQENWIRAYKNREADKQEFYFIIEDKNGQSVGTVRLYDFREAENSFCWGSWILKPSAPRKAAIESAILVYEFAFFDLGFDQCHFDVRKANERVIAFHQRFGAKIVDEGGIDYFFILPKGDYLSMREGYLDLIRTEEA